VVVAALLGVAVPAGAQDRLFHDGGELGALGHFGQRLGPASGLDGRLVAGGRVAVTDTEAADLPTGARRALPPGATVVALDPARPRVVLAMPGTGPAGTLDLALFELVPGTSETLVTGVCRSPVAGGAATVSSYAYDAQLVIAQRCRDGAAQDIVVIDVAVTPSQLRVLWSATTFASQLEVSSDGQRFFIRTALGFGTSRTHGFDVATGAALGTVEKGGDMRWDDALDALLVTTEGYLDAEVVVISRTMAVLAAAPFSERICTVRVQVSSHTGRVYVATDGGTNTAARPMRLEALAGAPLQSVAVAFPPPPTTQPCAPLVLRTAPGAPRGLSANVSGGNVALDWTNVGGASSFVLEVGVAPGRTDLSVFSGPDSQSSFAHVPSGTYYLRVRGANAFGGGRPSGEVRVVVP
jgi:hypothetical protein